ncbi:Transmembrane E3 ubiquitin-protein ligase 1 [Wickerhamiella sorbophila]|uniref:RING-type E3 ubiquitin transferase n=1 Tax=Wickerhamiella sorbophila TaxID=45607 RepID=A0A2T0FJM0_9ASCO|nr:Transmembrane E3 ubiquitin-protein ligase 1 [Wickerhamiella sorbophila]PRT55182.1 Transmembrane E3 ubiquitin-protein ligase 1 [Wickerhamiella sorbophila]
MADRSALLIFVVLCLLIASSSGPRSLTTNERVQLHSFIEWRENELDVVKQTSPSSALADVNLTNIAPAAPPPEIQAQVDEIWHSGDHNISAFYGNVDSILYGTLYHARSVAPHKMPVSTLFSGLVDPADPKKLQELSDFRLTISHIPGDTWVTASLVSDSHFTTALRGVYLEHGRLFLTTDSLKLSGSNGIPWLLPKTSEDELKKAYNATLWHSKQATKELVVLERIEDLEAAANRAGLCELMFFGHTKESLLSQSDLDDIEEELRNPQGRPIKKATPLKIEGMLYSPDCGIAFNLSSSGEPTVTFAQRSRLYAVVLLFSLIGVAALLGLQMNATRTPSMVTRVSLWSIAISSLVDGQVCIWALLISLGSDVAFTFIAVSFVAFALTGIFEIRYIEMIYKAQLTEWAATARVDGLPETETPQMPEDREVASRVSSRFYLVSMVFFAVSVLSLEWSNGLRWFYERVVLLVIYSNWIPQIILNVRKGSQTVLLPAFVVCTALLRLVPVEYFLLYSKNLGHHHYAPNLGWFLMGWQWIQVLLLISQHFFGPRFFLPAHMVQPVYDYHPILTTDIEHGLNTEEPPVTEEGPVLEPEENGVVKHVSCAICMNHVDLIICEEGSPPGPAALVARRKYMVTPCRHIYHTECLEEWMQSQLQCPICRNPLPPI